MFLFFIFLWGYLFASMLSFLLWVLLGLVFLLPFLFLFFSFSFEKFRSFERFIAFHLIYNITARGLTLRRRGLCNLTDLEK